MPAHDHRCSSAYPEASAGLTCVDFDFTAVSQLCAEHLVDLGHRCIALVGAPPAVYERETSYAEHVADGFSKTARRYGISSSVHAREANDAAARDMARGLLADLPDLTAVVVHSEAIVDQDTFALSWVPFPATALGDEPSSC